MVKILLVEDDSLIAEIYQKKFTASGFEVVNAVNGREALNRLHEGGFALTLLDLVLPEMSGLDVLREVKGQPGSYPGNPKIVVFSNLSSSEDRSQALRAGADGFISKTEFTPSEVVNEVNRLLKQFSGRDEYAEKSVPQEGDSTESAMIKKVLLIEDEPVFVEMFGKRLRDEGYDVTSETDGTRGLERALSGSFDLVITDFALPGTDGRSIAETMRSNAATASIPIFLLSASLDERDLRALETQGVIDRSFLKTHITPSDLASAVKTFFEPST